MSEDIRSLQGLILNLREKLGIALSSNDTLKTETFVRFQPLINDETALEIISNNKSIGDPGKTGANARKDLE
jgi:hypothetical protein